MKHHIQVERLYACELCGGDNNGRTLHIDHDHRCRNKVYKLNRKTGNMILDRNHPSKVACEKCYRGQLCYRCNKFVLGRLTLEQARSIVNYLGGSMSKAEQWKDAQTLVPWSTDVRLFDDGTGIVIAYINGQPQFIEITWAEVTE